MSDSTAHQPHDAAIRNLVARIALLADEGDLDDYTDQFTEDAVWNFPAGPRQGRKDIRVGAEERRASGTTGPQSRTRHILTNLAIEVADDSNATGICYFMFLNGNTTPPSLVNFGVYRDTYRRDDGVWRLARRDITPG